MFRYFKKKIKNLNTQDYYFTQSVVTLHAESEPFEPLRFEEIPVNPDGLIDKVKGSLLILNKKQYYDELPDDKTIQARNLSKLTTIKTYDRSLLQSRASCLSSSDSEEYLSMTTARIYEVSSFHEDFFCEAFDDFREPFSRQLYHTFKQIICVGNRLRGCVYDRSVSRLYSQT